MPEPDLNQIKNLREDHDLTQQQLAGILHISHTMKAEPGKSLSIFCLLWLITTIVRLTIFSAGQRKKGSTNNPLFKNL